MRLFASSSHFCDTSITTHLCVVFNASSVTSNGSNINNHLVIGPKLQTELPAVILHWRQFRFVYAADIAKMYRQILVDSCDIYYQRIFWKESLSESAKDYQLLTVTCGMACAPFLTLRVLRQLTDDEGSRFPLAVPVVKDHTYVDDVLFGHDDPDILREIRDQVVALLRRGGYELRKWTSNSSALLSDINAADHGVACSKSLSTAERLNILGLGWIPLRDKSRCFSQ
ncbi:uncharacterized protein LOC116850231 [Odontomachus brunneus]|uniref:uncharacterized protein LOC116850231 n=1 Tax=Odontomachus brunneus TaxID=486640 RepID=UPI0013F25D09|nr:uncharacterized protein LOC116850231 [Odontomachus brunneus]